MKKVVGLRAKISSYLKDNNDEEKKSKRDKKERHKKKNWS